MSMGSRFESYPHHMWEVIKKEKIWRYSRTHKTTLLVTYRQPLHNYLIGQLYHWYDMRTYKILHWLEEHFQPGPKSNSEEDILNWTPWSVERDCKCYYLSHKNRTDLGEEIIERVYDPIKKKDE